MGWNACRRKPEPAEFLRISQLNLDELRELEEEEKITLHRDDSGRVEGVHVLTESTVTMAAPIGAYLIRDSVGDIFPVNPEVFSEQFEIVGDGDG